MKYLDDKPFSLPTSTTGMSDIKYFLRTMTEKEFRKLYPGTTKAAYKMLLEFDEKGFLD